ncbi:hypothetical protein [Planktothricoides raciborskii]|uniref:Uncharacterized protein n=1 Tax=Planktothricoides raciborskii GIHE-MW2 TaxID=2792601 RepID=A0AAU8JGQ5_9CYAN
MWAVWAAAIEGWEAAIEGWAAAIEGWEAAIEAAIAVWAVWEVWVNDVVAMTRRRGQHGTDAH